MAWNNFMNVKDKMVLTNKELLKWKWNFDRQCNFVASKLVQVDRRLCPYFFRAFLLWRIERGGSVGRVEVSNCDAFPVDFNGDLNVCFHLSQNWNYGSEWELKLHSLIERLLTRRRRQFCFYTAVDHRLFFGDKRTSRATLRESFGWYLSLQCCNSGFDKGTYRFTRTHRSSFLGWLPFFQLLDQYGTRNQQCFCRQKLPLWKFAAPTIKKEMLKWFAFDSTFMDNLQMFAALLLIIERSHELKNSGANRKTQYLERWKILKKSWK